MKQIRPLFFLIALHISILINAQEINSSKGIYWTIGLSWDQIKQKAKQENKFIFIDVFATWCGPCKLMDKDVYTNDNVANYFNEKFISVKVQMDQTKTDNDYVKSWYSTAAAFTNQYRIEGYPTLIFLSPQAELVGKELGGRGTKELIAIAQTAIQSSNKYEDKFAEYDRLVADYKAGKRNYERMPYMISVSYQFGDSKLGAQLVKEHTKYIESLPAENRFTKENIKLWSEFILNDDGFIFQSFYKDAKFIDKVMNQPGYAHAVIDKTIQKTIVDSFYRMQGGETTLISGKKVKNSEIMGLGQLTVRGDGQINTDDVEADWVKLYRTLWKKFDKQTAERNVLLARLYWYRQHQNKVEEARVNIELYHQYPPDFKTVNIVEINQFAWNVFLYVPASEKKIFKATQKLLEKALDIYPNYMGMIDTYANLLYKSGKTKKAIKWEENVVAIAEKENAKRAANGKLPLRVNNSPEYFKLIVEQMKRGEKTYTKQGAMWN